MKTILYIGNNLSKSGKTETTIETLSEALMGEGYNIYVVSSKKNKVLRLLEMLLAILKFSKQVDYVLIDTYSTSNFYYAFLSSQLCRLLHLKYIPILHGGNLPNRLKNSPRLSRAIFNYAFKNIAPSKYMQSEFETLNYRNVVCIPNSINVKRYSFKNRDFDAVKLLWVRSFSEIYNPLLAIEILKLFYDEGVKASLCMIGPDNDGSLLKAKNYAESLKLDVRFTGKLSKKEWVNLSNDYNFFINTTNFDNMPVSVMEAMALGLPVISTHVGGIPFLIETEKEGILVPSNNAIAFVNAIKRLQSDVDTTNKMVFLARKKIENFDWDVLKNQWHSVLQ